MKLSEKIIDAIERQYRRQHRLNEWDNSKGHRHRFHDTIGCEACADLAVLKECFVMAQKVEETSPP